MCILWMSGFPPSTRSLFEIRILLAFRVMGGQPSGIELILAELIAQNGLHNIRNAQLLEVRVCL
jgi:hypothetical protein